MSKLIRASIARREFLISAPIWTLGAYFSGRVAARGALAQSLQNLPKELAPEELKIVEKSALAEDLPNYFGEGYSCAESLLMVSLRYLKKPEELVWIAAGFGGGMLHRDVCGFLTSGCMTLGLASGLIKPGFAPFRLCFLKCSWVAILRNSTKPIMTYCLIHPLWQFEFMS